MKPTINTSTLQSNSAPIENLQFQVSDMTIIMEALTKLYANPIKTLTQEYLCNARDSHREIKQTKPIEITLPVKLNPVLTIRDFGCGLSEERVKNVFIYYGGSTKRDTNAQTGGFGIGAKSAWSYTDSFTVKSYLDGVEYVYLAHKANGIGQLNLILKQATSEANGVAIEIAVNPNDISKFNAAVLQTVCFWNENETPTIKNIDGEISKIKPVYKFDRVEILETLPECFNNNYDNNSFIVVDGIAYPNKFTDSLKEFISNPFIIRLNTGEVNISPTRESLIDDEQNRAFFEKLQTSELKTINSFIDKQQNEIDSLQNGLLIVTSIMSTFKRQLTYKNFVFKKNYNRVIDIKILDNDKNYLHLGVKIGFNRSKVKSDGVNSITNTTILNKQIYLDDTTDSKAKRAWRIKKLLKTNKQIFILDKNLDKTIVDELQANSLAAVDCSDYTIKRAARQAIVKQELCLHYYENFKTRTKQVNIADVKDTIIYALLESETNSNKQNNYILNYIAETNKVAFISKSTLNKIKNNKLFVCYDKFLANYKTSEQEIKIYIGSKLRVNYPNLINITSIFYPVLDKIKDKTIKYLNSTNKDYSSIPIPEKLIPANHKLIKEYEKQTLEIKNLTKKYPLFSVISLCKLKAEQLDDLVNYVNSK